MKNKITGIISLALIAIGLLCSSALAIKNVIMLSGIIQPDPIEGVLQRGQYVEGDLYVHNTNIYRIDHSINLIPTGTERFYVAFDNENDTVYYIRANKKLGGGWDNAKNSELDNFKTEFVGYTDLEVETKILAIVKNGELADICETGDDVSVIIEKTPYICHV